MRKIIIGLRRLVCPQMFGYNDNYDWKFISSRNEKMSYRCSLGLDKLIPIITKAGLQTRLFLGSLSNLMTLWNDQFTGWMRIKRERCMADRVLNCKHSPWERYTFITCCIIIRWSWLFLTKYCSSCILLPSELRH